MARQRQNPQQVERQTVEDVIERIKNEFPSENEFCLNSSSKTSGNSFEKCHELYLALRFLAITFRDAMMNGLSGEDLRKPCREVSGFTYVPTQAKSTMGRFKNEYYIKYHGKKIPLKRHLRYGSNTHARHTIRIAFEWMDDVKKVVVGYVGKHQSNLSS